MKKTVLLIGMISMVLLLAFQTALALNETNATPTEKTTTAVKEVKKYSIPGGTKKFLSKQQVRKKTMTEEVSSFPYNLKEAVEWIRANKISLPDPISKRSLL